MIFLISSRGSSSHNHQVHLSLPGLLPGAKATLVTFTHIYLGYLELNMLQIKLSPFFLLPPASEGKQFLVLPLMLTLHGVNGPVSLLCFPPSALTHLRHASGAGPCGLVS